MLISRNLYALQYVRLIINIIGNLIVLTNSSVHSGTRPIENRIDLWVNVNVFNFNLACRF